MLRIPLWVGAVILGIVMATPPESPDPTDPDPASVVCGTGPKRLQCVLVDKNDNDEGSAAGEGGGQPDTAHAPQEGDCKYTQSPQQPLADDPLWEGRSPADGAIYLKSCYIKNSTPGLADGLAWTPLGPGFVASGQPPAFVQADARTLITRAVGGRDFPAPDIQLGPDPTRIAVKIPVWLWIQPGDARVEPLTVTAGTVSVTATTTAASTTWTVGEPYNDPDTGADPGHPQPFTCAGLGAPPPANVTNTAVPACGYTFIWKSTADRTDHTCTWPITMTVHWTINWQSNTGEAGTLTAESSTTTAVRVREYRTLLVAGITDPPDQPDPPCV